MKRWYWVLSLIAVIGTGTMIAVAANTIPSPNMGMPIPVVGTDPGPDWANNINASLSIVDQHDHSAGKGVPVTPAGLNINADLPFGGNNATTLRSTRFSPQGSPINGASDIGALYESGVDLYYNDGNGNQVRITSGGSVTGASGTITGLPSGTAGASFSGGTFSFTRSTNNPATLNVGPIAIGRNATSPYQVTLSSSSSMSGNYSMTLPTGLPGSTSFLNVDNAGSMGTVASTGSGSVVLAASPTLTGRTSASYLDVTNGGYGVSLMSINSGGSKYGTIQAENTGGTGAWSLGYQSGPPSTTLGTSVIKWTGDGTASIGGGPLFKMQNFTGTLAASTFTTILSHTGYTTMLGEMGWATAGGGPGMVPVPGNTVSGSGACTAGSGATICILMSSALDIVIVNNDNAHSNTYNITLFYN